MANLFYRNTNAQISFEVLDQNNNVISLSGSAVVFYYIKTPNNIIISNDPNVATYSYNNGIGSYVTSPIVQQSSSGYYYIQYVLALVGEYKYKFQITDPTINTILSGGGDIKVVGDGIF